MGIDIASIVAASRQAFAAAGRGPKDLFEAAENVRDKGSPLGVTPTVFDGRVEWLEDDYEVDLPIDKKGADVLLTVSSIELMKYPKSIVAMARLFNQAGVNWTFSSHGYEATNFGFLAGKSDIAKLAIERIVSAAEELGTKTLVIPECGHAYGVLRWSGANILGRPLPFHAMHITEYLAKLKREGKLKFKQHEGSITYHDPCQVSRRGGATADARYLLEDMAADFREMTPTGNFNWCCGGGGGVQAMSRAADLRHKVFQIKMKQVEDTGADMMISACANCRLTMDDSKAYWNWDRGLESLVELLAENLIEDVDHSVDLKPHLA
jgi:Fe-S oxidoreductase